MALADAELERLAELAILTLPSGSGRQELANHLGRIIDYVGAVRDLGSVEDDAAEDEPVRLRSDAVGATGDQSWLSQAPHVEGRFVTVPGLFGNE